MNFACKLYLNKVALKVQESPANLKWPDLTLYSCWCWSHFIENDNHGIVFIKLCPDTCHRRAPKSKSKYCIIPNFFFSLSKADSSFYILPLCLLKVTLVCLLFMGSLLLSKHQSFTWSWLQNNLLLGGQVRLANVNQCGIKFT